MAVPINLDATTAVEITSSPSDITQDVHDIGTGLTYTVWYSYFPTIDGVIGVCPLGALIGYTPQLTVWTGDPTAPTHYLFITNYAQGSTYLPVTAGENYFFQIVAPFGNPVPAILNLHFEVFNELTTLDGSLIINDASPGFPMVFLSPINGDPLRYINGIVAGELAARVNTGETIFQDVNTLNQVIYDTSFNIAATLPVDASQLSSNKVDKFYVGVSGVAPTTYATISAYTLTGTLIGTLTLTGSFALPALAPSLDDTILYYEDGGVSPAVKRWDLVGNAPLADLVAGIANFQIREMLILDDNTILVLYFNGSTLDTFVNRYATDGTLMNTYIATGNTGIDPHLAYGIDDPTTFWAWHKIAGGFSRFLEINSDTGAIVTQFERYHFTSGHSDEPTTLTPTDYFGHSESCTFLIIPITTPPIVENNASGIYKIVPGKRQDTLWVNPVTGTTRDVKKPNPFAKLGYLGE